MLFRKEKHQENKSILTKKTLIKSFSAVFAIERQNLILTSLIISKCTKKYVKAIYAILFKKLIEKVMIENNTLLPLDK